MKITLCGSFVFSKEILAIRDQLTNAGHEVLGYEVFVDVLNKPSDQKDRYTDIEVERKAMIYHHNSVAAGDAILICNFDKNNIPGYIGGSTLMEIGIAYHLKKKIFALNKLPDDTQLKYVQEIVLANPTIINNDLSLIQ